MSRSTKVCRPAVKDLGVVWSVGASISAHQAGIQIGVREEKGRSSLFLETSASKVVESCERSAYGDFSTPRSQPNQTLRSYV